MRSSKPKHNLAPRTRGGCRARFAAPIALTAALLVSACPQPDQSLPPGDALATAMSRQGDRGDISPLDFSRYEPASGVVPAAPWPAAPEPSGPVARPAAPPLNDNPEQVMGLGIAALKALIGPPRLRRNEPPAQVWHYRGGTCVLDVFLYLEGAADPYRVVYYEIRAERDDLFSRRRCFRAFLRQDGEV